MSSKQKIQMKKTLIFLIFAVTLANSAIAENIVEIFRNFEKENVAIADSLAKNGRYEFFEVFAGTGEKTIYDKDYNFDNDENIVLNTPEIWRSAYYLEDKNTILHEYTCHQYCGGNTQTIYRLFPYENEIKFSRYVLYYATRAECEGELDVYDFSPDTGKFTLNVHIGNYDYKDVSVESFFKKSTPDFIMEKFACCFSSSETDNRVAQYWLRTFYFTEEQREEIEEYMLGDTIDVYFLNGNLILSEPYFDEYWQW